MIKPTKFHEGSVRKSKSCGDFKIIKYVSTREIHIKFLDTGFETAVNCSTVSDGSVKDKLLPTVCGVGILGYGKHCGKGHSKEYTVWKSALIRCYDKKYQNRNPKYVGCEVSCLFKRFDLFKEWYFRQVGHDQEGWHLDKDILVKGNMVYSEDTCCFVPPEINYMFKSKRSDSNVLPRGISIVRNKYVARYGSCEKRYIGTYETMDEAFYVYKQAKESHIKEVASKWKDQIDLRVYEALMKYEVNIDD